MSIRAASLVVALALTATGLAAQGPGQPPPNYQQLVAEIANLKARVAKLEGSITQADLVGTYNVRGFLVGLTGGAAASIGSGVLSGTVTLAADGTASLSSAINGYNLTQGSPWTRGMFSAGGVETSTWTYANGVVTTTSPDETMTFTVGGGGRLLIGASAHTNDDGLSLVVIATRVP